MKLDFIRGHMGGNIIVLLDGEQLPAGGELAAAVKILGPHYLSGHEAGLLYPASCGAGLRLKIAEPTSGCFISACGGLTQVLGKALVEANLGERYAIMMEEPSTVVLLETDAGTTELMVELSAGKTNRVTTTMDAFVLECGGKGVGRIELQGIPAVQAGKFLVLNADQVKQRHPGADFCRWDSTTRLLLSRLQQEFMARTGEAEYNLCLYDWRPDHGGDLRVVYPHCVSQDFIEPSCGTGSVAVGMAVLESGELQQRLGPAESALALKLEAGGGIELGGPDITELFLEVSGGNLLSARFSHSLVEITAIGQVLL